MNEKLLKKIGQLPDVKYVFFDYYDTVIHRRVHPLQPFKSWAKILKKEMTLSISVNDLYNLRRKALRNLSSKTNCVESELNYEKVMQEIYNKLVDLEKISSAQSFNKFLDISNSADYESESSVQYLNTKTVNTLRSLKNKGYKIYCVSDYHSDEELMSKLLAFHGIRKLYDKVYISASQNASKENQGLLFKKIIKEEGILPTEIFMVGDNPVSDIANAKLNGIEAFYLKRYSYKVKQKIQFIFFIFRNKWGGMFS